MGQAPIILNTVVASRKLILDALRSSYKRGQFLFSLATHESFIGPGLIILQQLRDADGK